VNAYSLKERVKAIRELLRNDREKRFSSSDGIIKGDAVGPERERSSQREVETKETQTLCLRLLLSLLLLSVFLR
jgi:hypothetical protein